MESMWRFLAKWTFPSRSPTQSTPFAADAQSTGASNVSVPRRVRVRRWITTSEQGHAADPAMAWLSSQTQRATCSARASSMSRKSLDASSSSNAATSGGATAGSDAGSPSAEKSAPESRRHTSRVSSQEQESTVSSSTAASVVASDAWAGSRARGFGGAAAGGSARSPTRQTVSRVSGYLPPAKTTSPATRRSDTASAFGISRRGSQAPSVAVPKLRSFLSPADVTIARSRSSWIVFGARTWSRHATASTGAGWSRTTASLPSEAVATTRAVQFKAAVAKKSPLSHASRHLISPLVS
mmetsp:Transcript_25588/g.87498  ORF Transcript_25588/g.87498 Transcript_25588/m.87498 type:complete len:297 (-) Transcript_25588:53-943(-)